MSGLDYSRKRQVLTMITWEGVKAEKLILDDKTKALYDFLEGKFPGYEVMVASENDDETKRTVWVGSDKVTGRFYYHEDGKDDLQLLCDRTPWLKEEQPGRHGADHVHEPRRPDDPRLPHVAQRP